MDGLSQIHTFATDSEGHAVLGHASGRLRVMDNGRKTYRDLINTVHYAMQGISQVLSLSGRHETPSHVRNKSKPRSLSNARWALALAQAQGERKEKLSFN